MAADNNTTGGGIGFCGLLTVLFIGLKLTHYINWSWLWVFSPLWIPIPVILLGITIVMIIQGVMLVLEAYWWRDDA